MWQKLKEQIPAIVLTAALVFGAAAFMVQKVVERQRAELEPLRAQNQMLREQAEENRRQIAATTKLLKDALAQNGGTVFQPEAQIAKINEERLTRLAEVIAQRVAPALPTAKSPAELEAAENEHIDKVAGRLASDIRPVLADALAQQKVAADSVVQASEQRVQQLNVGLLATQAAAQDALKLSRELAALYSDSFKDHGVLMRIFALPANLVIDAAKLNFVGGERAKTEKELATKIELIEKRLNEVQSLASVSGS